MTRNIRRKLMTRIATLCCAASIILYGVSLRWILTLETEQGLFGGIVVGIGYGALGFGLPHAVLSAVRSETVSWSSDLWHLALRPYVLSDVQILTIPLWMFVVPSAAWFTILLRRNRRERHPNACPACNYNLTANISGRCPECGTPTSPLSLGASSGNASTHEP